MTNILNAYNRTDHLYNLALYSTWQLREWINDPDYAQGKDPEAWEKIQRDATIAQAIRHRLHAVAGTTWTVEPAGDSEEEKDLAGLVEDAFRTCIRSFQDARVNIATAIFRGSSLGYIQGSRKNIQLGSWGGLIDAKMPAMDWWVPETIQPVDKRRFRIHPKRRESGGQVTGIDAIPHIWSIQKMEWLEMKNPENFIRMVYQDEESRLGYGRGILDSVYFLWWMKNQVLQHGLNGLDRWAGGLIHAKLDDTREGSTAKTNTAQATALKDAIKKMRSGNVIVTGSNEDIQNLETSGTGHQIIEFFLRYIDDSILGTLAGSVLPFGGGDSGGSFARAEVEEGVSEGLYQADREKLDETITETLIAQFLRLNRPQLAMVGLADARSPRFSTVQQSKEDPEKNVGVISQALAAGIPLKKTEVYERIGMTMPGDGDDVIEGQEAPAMPPGMFPFLAKETTHG